ncbi:VCBS repeat-containing protein, partial [candidate division KSB1 bacterium]|nr:VCBS repeat-containing protein [candidate division KSB1 bacterium]
MDRDIWIAIIFVVLLTFSSVWGQDRGAQEDSLFLPLPRKDPLITYRPLAVHTISPIQPLTADQIEKTVIMAPKRSAFESTGSYLLAKTIRLPAGTALIGKVGITTHANVFAAGDSVPLVIQISMPDDASDTFSTVARGFLHNDDQIDICFSAQHARALRIVYDASRVQQDPIANLQAYEVQLSSDTRIMLLGDSITDGKYADDGLGYRKELYHMLLGKGLSIDFVGSYGDPPYESHFQGGRKIQDFYPIALGGTARLDVTADMDNYRPNVVAIHLGTNNLGDGFSGPVGPYGTGLQFNTTPTGCMATLVNYLLRWHNGNRGTELHHIFVSLIIPIKYQDSLMITSSIEVARMVRDFQQGVITGQPEPVYIVDPFTRFYEDPALLASYYKSHMYDRLHPNTYGHHVMALTHADAITPVLSGQMPWFSDVTWETNTAGFDNQFGGQGVAAADVDQDGDEDIYVSRIAKNGVNCRDYYFQNQPNGTFQENAEALTIQDAGDSRGVLFADVDNDGDLDLINGNSPGRNRLYDNLQNTTFQDVTASSGLDNVNSVTTALLVFDCENDGDLDFYAVNSRTVNEFYLNNGLGHFTRTDRGANDV